MLEIKESRVLQRDRSYQLQRVVTSDGSQFLTKVAVSDYCEAEEAVLAREFTLFSELRSQYSLTPIRLGRVADKLAAYYEDFDGVPLSRDADARRLDWRDFAQVAHELCSTLGAFHEHGLILAGVAPDSFLRSPLTRRLRLVDAAFARRIEAREEQLDTRWCSSACLNYAAPELIGSSALACDQRSDLYSLGALLYRLICGRTPFEASDAAGLIQCHLAKTPPSPALLNPSLPPGLGELVLKLLAKNPDERFSSVEEADQALVEVLATSQEKVSQSSVPAELGPVSRTLSFSNKLYGRDPALRSLRSEIERKRSAPLMVFVQGDAGVGKTSLLQELQRAPRQGFLAVGKFSQSGRTLPLSGWATALRDLATALLTRQPQELEVWRSRILRALGEGTTLIADLVPEWATLLTGPRRAHDVTLDTNLNRIAVAIRSLLGCYASVGDPMVVVLDDLQLADTSSLRILELVLALPEPIDLLVIGAARTTERAELVSDELSRFRNNLRVAGVATQSLQLGPWTEAELVEFFEDSFVLPLLNAPELRDLVQARTHGNPFFVRELMGLLAQQGTFSFDRAASSWHWRRQTVRQLPLADDVVSFLSSRMRGLSSNIKQSLSVAACLGSDFSLGDFCVVTEATRAEAIPRLQEIVKEGLLAERSADSAALVSGAADRVFEPKETHYEFVHDRVLEACRLLLSLPERETLHLRVGRTLLLERGNSDEHRLYQVAGHFNEARHLVVSVPERYEVAELNLRVGKLAKQRGAISQALEYLLGGLALLAPGTTLKPLRCPEVDATTWRERFELTRSLHEEAAEAALLHGKLDLMHLLCDAILARVASPREQVTTYAIRIRGLSAEKKFAIAVDVALEILHRLGIHFPKRPNALHAIVGFLRTKRELLAQPLTRLTELPRKQDPDARAVALIIQSVYPAAYLGRPKIFPLLVYRHVSDSLRYGNEAYSAVTYNAFAIVLAAMGEFQTALRLGDVSLELLKRLEQGSFTRERFDALRLKAQVFMGYYTFVFPWCHHLRDSLAPMDEGLQAAFEHGDFEFASYLMTVQSLAKLHTGVRIGELAKEFEWGRAKVASLGHERSILLQDLLCQVVFDLEHGFPAAGCLAGPFYAEATMLPRCFEPMDHNLVFHHYLAKLMVCLFLGNIELGRQTASAGRPHAKEGAFGLYLGALFLFYDSLLELSSASGVGVGRGVWSRSRRAVRTLKRLAVAAPMTFANKYHLLEAERLRLRGKNARAALHFEKAIELAQEQGLVHECAFGQERAACFYQSSAWAGSAVNI